MSAHLAGTLGLPFAYAHHFAAQDTEKVLESYRSAFRPSSHLRPQPLSEQEALTYDFSPHEQEILAERKARQAIGTPEQVRQVWRSLIASTGADEVMFQVVGATAAGRLRSLEIAQAGTIG